MDESESRFSIHIDFKFTFIFKNDVMWYIIISLLTLLNSKLNTIYSIIKYWVLFCCYGY